jgi:hypothetical protein
MWGGAGLSCAVWDEPMATDDLEIEVQASGAGLGTRPR